MALFEVFIPGKDSSMPNVTLTIDAPNWIGALRSGLKSIGEGQEAIANVMCDIKEDNSIHVTDVATRRVFRLREVQAKKNEPKPISIPDAPPIDGDTQKNERPPEMTQGSPKQAAAAAAPPKTLIEFPAPKLDAPAPSLDHSVPWTKMPAPDAAAKMPDAKNLVATAAPASSSKMSPAPVTAAEMTKPFTRATPMKGTPAPVPAKAQQEPVRTSPATPIAKQEAVDDDEPDTIRMDAAHKPIAPSSDFAEKTVRDPSPPKHTATTATAAAVPVSTTTTNATNAMNAAPAKAAPTNAAPTNAAPTNAAGATVANAKPTSSSASMQARPAVPPTPRGVPAPAPKRPSGQFAQAPEPRTREVTKPNPATDPKIGRAADVKAKAGGALPGKDVQEAIAAVFDATQDLYLESALSPQKIADKLLDIALSHIPADAGTFYLADVNGHELTFAAVRGPKADALKRAGVTVPVGQGIIGFCAQEGVCLAVSDIQKDPRFDASIAKTINYTPKDTLCASAEREGRLWGAVQLINSKAGFDAADMEVLRFIGLTAAAMLERVSG